MRAMVITGFGGPEVFAEQEVPSPTPGPTQLLVRVHATSVNPVDAKVRQAGHWAITRFPAVIGWDVSGVVEAAGEGVVGFAAGDEVFYSPQVSGSSGTYAEYNAVEAALVAKKPAGLSHEEAASIPLAGGTAYEGLMTRAQVRLGDSVLVHAAAGGVGSLAVQIAKAAGAFVCGTCRAENLDYVRSLGADVAIDHRAEDFVEAVNRATAGAGVDVVYDTVGGDALPRSIGCAKAWARLVTIVDIGASIDAARNKNQTVYLEYSQRSAEKMEALRVLVERGQLRPQVDSVLPLSEVAKAHERLAQGGVRGKIVLTVA